MKTRSSNVRIATIRGVELKLHASLIALFLYVAFVATLQFPVVVKQAGLDASMITGPPALWGMIFAVALLVSVTLHEFGHVLAAQALGVKVKGVTLMMLGGVSEMERIPEQPFAEFKLAVVGPMVSFAISALMWAISSLGGGPELQLFTSWVGSLNLLLAVFNLLPAFPMDGGRALRSLLAARQGPLRATQTAVGISKAIAWGLGALGLISFNLLLMFIAFFVYTAASQELLLLVSREMLRGLTAGDVGVRTRFVHQYDRLNQVAEEMLRSRNTVLPVRTASGNAAVVGMDMLSRIPRTSWGETHVSDIMEEVPRSLSVEEPLDQALTFLAATRSGALPLLEAGELVGVVRQSDLVNTAQFRGLREEDETHRAA